MSGSTRPSEDHEVRSSQRRDRARSRSPERKRRKRSEDSESPSRYQRSRSNDRNHRRSNHSRDQDFEDDQRRPRSRRDEVKRTEERRPRSDPSSRHRSRRDDHDDSKSIQPYKKSAAPLPSQQDAFTGTSGPPEVEKQKPNFSTTGKLAAAANTVKTANQTIVLKYHEPSESRKPPARDQWRLYVFKDDEILETVPLSDQSCWLFGRETAVCDISLEHPSASKQHAVIQFRYIEKRNEFGDVKGRVKPYVLDLESANGTILNGEAVPPGRYVEVRDADVLTFGHSSREYVVQMAKEKPAT